MELLRWQTTRTRDLLEVLSGKWRIAKNEHLYDVLSEIKKFDEDLLKRMNYIRFHEKQIKKVNIESEWVEISELFYEDDGEVIYIGNYLGKPFRTFLSKPQSESNKAWMENHRLEWKVYMAFRHRYIRAGLKPPHFKRGEWLKAWKEGKLQWVGKPYVPKQMLINKKGNTK
jgi:hypothetical protein